MEPKYATDGWPNAEEKAKSIAIRKRLEAGNVPENFLNRPQSIPKVEDNPNVLKNAEAIRDEPRISRRQPDD